MWKCPYRLGNILEHIGLFVGDAKEIKLGDEKVYLTFGPHYMNILYAKTTSNGEIEICLPLHIFHMFHRREIDELYKEESKGKLKIEGDRIYFKIKPRNGLISIEKNDENDQIKFCISLSAFNGEDLVRIISKQPKEEIKKLDQKVLKKIKNELLFSSEFLSVREVEALLKISDLVKLTFNEKKRAIKYLSLIHI